MQLTNFSVQITPERVMANSADPDQMVQKVTSDQVYMISIDYRNFYKT